MSVTLEPTDRLVKRRSAAALMDVKPQTLAKWAMEGKGPPVVKIGDPKWGRTFYRLSDVMRWVKQGDAA
jgi:phage terminase Nu1 subunit (DNA packaging protein)